MIRRGAAREPPRVFSFSKMKDEASSAARPELCGKTALFPRNDRPHGLKRAAFQTENAHASAGTDQGRGSSEDDRCAFRAMHTSSVVILVIVLWHKIFPSSCGLVASFFQFADCCIYMSLFVTKYCGIFSRRKFEGESRDSSMLSKTSAPESMFWTVSHVISGNFSRAM